MFVFLLKGEKILSQYHSELVTSNFTLKYVIKILFSLEKEHHLYHHFSPFLMLLDQHIQEYLHSKE